MSFLRLVGVVYMKKHGCAFIGITPEAYFKQSLKHSQTTIQHHGLWLDKIRQCIWDRIQFENEMVPNTDSLYRHYKRVCWVLDLWRQADRNTLNPKPLCDYGWSVQNENISVAWDSDSNMDSIRERVSSLLKGCGCKTGCHSRQCGCKGKGKLCGEGCNCINCTNTGTQTIASGTNSMEEASIEEIITDTPPEDLDEVMEWVFGDYEGDMVSEEESDDG